jgi:hypothetical protein
VQGLLISILGGINVFLIPLGPTGKKIHEKERKKILQHDEKEGSWNRKRTHPDVVKQSGPTSFSSFLKCTELKDISDTARGRGLMIVSIHSTQKGGKNANGARKNYGQLVQ